MCIDSTHECESWDTRGGRTKIEYLKPSFSVVRCICGRGSSEVLLKAVGQSVNSEECKLFEVICCE
jgi:hypothetical protein